MAFFACGTRDKPYIRPLRSGTFLYRYGFWAGLASTTSGKVSQPASNFRRALAERKRWHAELCSAFGMGVPRERREPGGAYELYREFRTQRKALNVLSVLRRTVEQESSYAPPGSRRSRGASLMQKLLSGKVRGQWRFIPRNSKKVENSLHICVDFRQLKFHTPFHPLGDVNTHGSFTS